MSRKLLRMPMSERYDICFSGQVLEGHDAETVRARLAKLFKADRATLDKLFSGRTQIIKRGCDKATALQYKKAMENAGAQPIFRASAKPNDKTPSQEALGSAATPSSIATSADTQNSGITLAPPQSDVLRDSERQVVVERKVDTSMLQLNEAGSLLTSTPPAPITLVNTDHISVAEAGAEIPNLLSPEAPPIPSTDDIQLTAVGGDMSGLAPAAAEAPRVDLSGLRIEPPGSDILEKHQRRSTRGKIPPTDHLSIKD
ncbi:hypothetical protein [Candidatus Marimicrobium litorale]|uniref:Uncharacterized protein n=1 Tax=Candidatus Marimicrobium litorale TaxID=2518991 RepID=A0ABT3T3C9_9GAMM|nr:hypothetical protein [Candidatus Marimicrobium litorale]MCX2976665.1 hypothetical protein [Candidatus Marimicrobium litorale]